MVHTVGLSIPLTVEICMFVAILHQGVELWTRMVHGVYYKKCFGLFTLFSLQAVICLLQVFDLEHLYSGP